MKAGDGETSIVKTPYEAYETIRDGYGKLSHERFIKKGGLGSIAAISIGCQQAGLVPSIVTYNTAKR